MKKMLIELAELFFYAGEKRNENKINNKI